MQHREQEAHEVFVTCERAHPGAWQTQCHAEYDLWAQSMSAAIVERTNNTQNANAFGAAVLGTGLAVLGAAASAQASRETYCWHDRWGRRWCN
ncbi:hypothetical protein [Paraburkholderia flagellata]|uniref:hypothetical protein n=1 Tax=Paraburkholderia flagellata TaxID=2883241 RepID=UPI001F1EFE0A|nr:hypothetical protein [Paraburkholderia flagellata]